MIQTSCPQQYTKNQMNAGWQLNAIRVRRVNIGGIVNFELYFPRPWLLVGLLNYAPSSEVGLPSWNYSYTPPLTPGDHQTYQSMLESIFLDCAFATTNEPIGGWAVTYVGPGIQSVNYLGYFTKYLNAPIGNTPEQWYNSITQPLSVIRKFMNDNGAIAEDVWNERHRSMLNFLKSTIDQSLMGAPGIYRIAPTGAATPLWNAESEYETFIEE